MPPFCRSDRKEVAGYAGETAAPAKHEAAPTKHDQQTIRITPKVQRATAPKNPFIVTSQRRA
ncbi:protein of unknown function [Cupriavidus taiwanensis]|uniref:Uncharacterized protein n=1 Tax=Cupriavidus taiwanensis TaxID=164546 RepID=A0A7Z7JAS8_9BURK|nr:protein of unknown function [Cupriavidus taiwanensis]SOZ03937.1 hypothetical protein CBM2597_A50113 [Cupriavidus taiwanensis]SOZ04425.1 hypothetical protein CBM2595_A50041 [Cupriavidus taiwanensis]SPC09834.1 hypothetical protein CBM2594_A41157 [Cupriavidus taiwanensis]SPD39618.1 protein of unknown function [Cupriavidus taiwanensis]